MNNNSVNLLGSFTFSIVAHITFFALFFLLSYSNIFTPNYDLNIVNPKTEIIDIKLIETFEQNPIQRIKAKESKSSQLKDGYIKSQNVGKFSSNTHSNSSSEKEKKAQSKRYEYLLSQEFTRLAPIINEIFSDMMRINIWIKINKNGDVLDSGIAENTSLEKLQIIRRAVSSLSPFPKPPQIIMNDSETQQYLIPVLIK